MDFKKLLRQTATRYYGRLTPFIGLVATFSGIHTGLRSLESGTKPSVIEGFVAALVATVILVPVVFLGAMVYEFLRGSDSDDEDT